MSRFKGLSLVGNTWVVRKVVPAELREIVGKRELLKSLQTGDSVEARRFYPGVWRSFEKTISEARLTLAAEADGDKIDLKEINQKLGGWVQAAFREPFPETGDLTTPWFIQEQIDQYQAAVAEPAKWRDIPDIDAETVAHLATLGVSIHPDHRAFPEVRARFIKARHILYFNRERERLAREWRKQPSKPLFAPTTPLEEPTSPDPKPPVVIGPKPSRMTVKALFDDWVIKVAKPNPKERGRLDHQITRFVEFLGGDRPINLVTKGEASEFLSMVARYPTRRSDELQALPFKLLIRQFENDVARLKDENEKLIADGKLPKPIPATLTKSTLEGWFFSYRRMFAHAVAQDLLDKNPFEGLGYLVTGSDSQKRRAFTDDEIKHIFTQPRFQGGSAGADFWLPVLSLLHGSRLSELAALPLSAVKVGKGGERYFDLEGQQVKNDGSERIIPFHPEAVRLGVLDYIAELRRNDEVWLFPDLNHETKHGPGRGFSQQWGRWMEEVGMTDPALTFHSFRHSWKRKARASDVKEEIHDILSGHASTTVSRRYGEGLDVSDLAKNMALIEFAALPEIRPRR